MRAIRWLVVLGVVSVVGPLIFTLAYLALHSPRDTVPEGYAIVAISGPGPETRMRTARAVELFFEDRAPLLVVSGGTGAAADMKAQAMAAGVPEDAIRVEDASRSTLQNALFVRDLGFDPAARLLLVTHRYHQPRARASFWWAGFTDVISVAADPDARIELTRGVLMEGVKWPVNIGRAAIGSAAMAMNAPRERWIGWLN